MYYVRVSGKGQVTIPAPIRKSLGLKSNDLVALNAEGGIVRIKRLPGLRELSGTLKAKGSTTIKQLRRDTEQAVAQRALERAGMVLSRDGRIALRQAQNDVRRPSSRKERPGEATRLD